ncbi:MAG TPA: hypothetical protein DCK76_09735 [Desulfotomaculum sp.]|nr:hypothetical protein [Desulfotomaculum sp.]
MFGVPYLVAQVLSYSAGVANSFFFNRKWTFRVERKANILEAANFVIVNGFSLLTSFGLLAVLHDLNHLDLWISKCIVTGAAIIVNYIGSRFWVFSRRAESEI